MLNFSRTMVGLAGAMVLLATATNAQVNDFRVETDIYFSSQKGPPDRQSVTLFQSGIYYDYALDDPTAVTIIDPDQGRIILLDTKRNIKTTLQMQELLEVVEAARLQASSSAELAEIVQAANNVQFDEQQKSISVGSSPMLYNARTQQPPNASIAEQFAAFANWSARLNAVHTSRRPPFIRLRLNDELAQRGLLPAEITLTTHANGKQSQTVRSRLIAHWQLSAADNDKIRQTNELLQRLSEVKTALFFAQQAK